MFVTEQTRVAIDRVDPEDGGTLARVRVIVVDSHRLLANALGIAIGTDPEIDVVGMYADLGDAADFARTAQPDVLLIDFFSLTHGVGPALVAALQIHSPKTRILVLTEYEDQQTLLTCIRSGADGYLTKQSPSTALIDAIKRLQTGEVLYPSMALVDLLIAPQSRRAETNVPSPPHLFPRELDVLQAVANGLTTDEVAAQLGIAVDTVRAHLRSILAKLGARSKLEAVIIGLRTGLIKLSD